MKPDIKLAIFALLTGCSTLPELPKETLVPVPVPCVEAMPDKPRLLTDAELAKLADYQLVLAIRQDQLALRAYAEILEALMLACVR